MVAWQSLFVACDEFGPRFDPIASSRSITVPKVIQRIYQMTFPRDPESYIVQHAERYQLLDHWTWDLVTDNQWNIAWPTTWNYEKYQLSHVLVGAMVKKPRWMIVHSRGSQVQIRILGFQLNQLDIPCIRKKKSITD